MLNYVNPGPLQLIGSGLIKRLHLAFDPKLFVHAMMPARLTPQAWTELTRRTPFIGLGWNELRQAPDLARQFRGITRWTVYLVTRNASGEQGRYFGDAQGLGLFNLVQVATAMLHGVDIAGIGTASVTSAANAVAEGWEGGNAVIAALDVEVPIDLSPRGVLASLSIDDFITDAITWDFLPATDSLEDTIIIPKGAT